MYTIIVPVLFPALVIVLYLYCRNKENLLQIWRAVQPYLVNAICNIILHYMIALWLNYIFLLRNSDKKVPRGKIELLKELTNTILCIKLCIRTMHTISTEICMYDWLVKPQACAFLGFMGVIAGLSPLVLFFSLYSSHCQPLQRKASKRRSFGPLRQKLHFRPHSPMSHRFWPPDFHPDWYLQHQAQGSLGPQLWGQDL